MWRAFPRLANVYTLSSIGSHSLFTPFLLAWHDVWDRYPKMGILPYVVTLNYHQWLGDSTPTYSRLLSSLFHFGNLFSRRSVLKLFSYGRALAERPAEVTRPHRKLSFKSFAISQWKAGFWFSFGGTICHRPEPTANSQLRNDVSSQDLTKLSFLSSGVFLLFAASSPSHFITVREK